MFIRSAAKALVVREGRLLLIRRHTEDGSLCYDLPGGGQEPYEPLEQAVVRELLEETGYHVHRLAFAALAEEIYEDPTLRAAHPDFTHRVLHIFWAELAREQPDPPSESDLGQEGIEWVPVDRVPLLPDLHPSCLRAAFCDMLRDPSPRYLGCVYIPG